MNYYEKNIDCIKEIRETLYKGIEQKKDTKKHEVDNIFTVNSKEDENLSLVVIKERIEYRLNSNYYPIKEAKQWSAQYEIKNLNSIIVMFGLGNGVFARELISKMKKNDFLFIYEPSFEIFEFVINNYDMSDIIKNSNVIISIDDIDRTTYYSTFEGQLSITNMTSQIWCTHPKYSELYSENYQDFVKNLKEHIHHSMLNINTRKHFGMRYIENTLNNLYYIKDSNRLIDYSNVINIEIPAIILAAGPSLKEDINDLKKIKGKAYIFVVDRILDYVLDEGIEPDFIVTVDPIKPLEYFTRRPDVKIPLLCNVDSNWEILKHHKGKKIICCVDEYIGKLYLNINLEPPMLELGNSVATVAFSACEKLGFKTIILAGQDLAYDGELTHAGGIAEKITTENEIYVKGIDGNQVRSRWDWYEFLRWYKRKIELNPDLTVIDIKRKGAKIDGTKNLPLDIAMKEYCTKEIDREQLGNIKSTFTEENKEEINKFIVNSFDEFEKIKVVTNKAIDICKKQIKGYKRYSNTNKSFKNRLKMISKINKDIINTSIYALVENMINAKSTYELSKLYQLSDDEVDDTILTYERSINIYNTILEVIDIIKPIMKEILPTIN